jgi:hypothetical protein
VVRDPRVVIVITGGNSVAESDASSPLAAGLRSLRRLWCRAPNLTIGNGSGTDARSFGAAPDQVATVGGAWLTGLHAAGVVGCTTSFPGSGGVVDLALYRALIASARLQPQTWQVFACAQVVASLSRVMARLSHSPVERAPKHRHGTRPPAHGSDNRREEPAPGNRVI